MHDKHFKNAVSINFSQIFKQISFFRLKPFILESRVEILPQHKYKARGYTGELLATPSQNQNSYIILGVMGGNSIQEWR